MVVLYELTATTIDKDYLQKLYEIRQTFHKRGDLLVPTMTDWWETAKMIRRLRFGEKTTARGRTPKMPDAHRLQNDALIARSASLHDCFIVTTNTTDFNCSRRLWKNSKSSPPMISSLKDTELKCLKLRAKT